MEENKILGQLFTDSDSYDIFLLTESQVRLLKYLNEYMDIDVYWNPLVFIGGGLKEI